MKIVFVHRGGEQMASYRYRSAIPAIQLNTINGYQATVNEGEADAVIFSKPTTEDIALAKQVKLDGAKVIVDIGDDHLQHPMIGPVYKSMLELADHVVTPTKEMSERLYRISGKSPVIIPDPYEYPQGIPHAVGKRLLWFGHEKNLKDLSGWKDCLATWDLTIITGPRDHKGMLRWSHETMLFKLAESNIVLIPMRKGQEFKSNNRLINAVRAGCFVVAGESPAHEEFRKMLWVGSIKHGLEWARAFPDDLNGLVAQAQAYVEANYSPQKIGALWADLIG